MTLKSRQQTLSQQRAAWAWKCVSQVKDCKEDEVKGRYGALVRKCPSLVLTMGLGQTLAFVKAKAAGRESASKKASAKASELAYEHIGKWLEKRMGFSVDFIDWVTQAKSSDYRRAGAETVAFLTWLKLFAESELPSEDDDSGGGS